MAASQNGKQTVSKDQKRVRAGKAGTRCWLYSVIVGTLSGAPVHFGPSSRRSGIGHAASFVGTNGCALRYAFVVVLLCGIGFARGAPQVSVETDQSGKNCTTPLHEPGSCARPGNQGGGQAEPARVRSLPRNLLLDQKDFWTSPARIRVGGLRWLLPFTAASASLIACDTRIESHLPDGSPFINGTRIFSTAGVASLGGTASFLYIWGRFGGDEHKRETGLLSAEAAANSFIVMEIMKVGAGRQRPIEGDGKGKFWHGGRSFPSGHATLAWSTAAVIAHEYPGKLPKVLAYGVATGVAATRVTGRRHFASDALVGSALGWYMGRLVFRRHHGKDLEHERYGSFFRDAYHYERIRASF